MFKTDEQRFEYVKNEINDLKKTIIKPEFAINEFMLGGSEHYKISEGYFTADLKSFSCQPVSLQVQIDDKSYAFSICECDPFQNNPYNWDSAIFIHDGETGKPIFSAIKNYNCSIEFSGIDDSELSGLLDMIKLNLDIAIKKKLSETVLGDAIYLNQKSAIKHLRFVRDNSDFAKLANATADFWASKINESEDRQCNDLPLSSKPRHVSEGTLLAFKKDLSYRVREELEKGNNCILEASTSAVDVLGEVMEKHGIPIHQIPENMITKTNKNSLKFSSWVRGVGNVGKTLFTVKTKDKKPVTTFEMGKVI